MSSSRRGGGPPNPRAPTTNPPFSPPWKNTGPRPPPPGVTLGVGFSIDGGQNVTWSSSYSSSLATNASVTLTANGGPTGSSTWKATPGLHTLTATADDINRFPESNEINNAMSVNLAISSGPPRIGPVTVTTNNVAGFTFSATTGIHYLVQYKNDLKETQWSDLGSDVVASSKTVFVSDDFSGVAQPVYRVLQSK